MIKVGSVAGTDSGNGEPASAINYGGGRHSPRTPTLCNVCGEPLPRKSARRGSRRHRACYVDGVKLKPKSCVMCGDVFQPKKGWQATCSRTCGAEYRWTLHRSSMMDTVRKAAEGRRRAAFERTKQEISALVADKPTWTRNDVVRLLVSVRRKWFQSAWVLGWQKGRQPKARRAA